VAVVVGGALALNVVQGAKPDLPGDAIPGIDAIKARLTSLYGQTMCPDREIGEVGAEEIWTEG
jgi:hypothetical protein